LLPTLFHVGPYPVDTHDFFVLLGVVAATVVFFAEAQRRAVLSEQLIWIVVGTLFCGAVAARLGSAWQYVVSADSPSLEGLLARGGKTILGGLAGAYVGAVLTKRLIGYRARTGDLFAPAVALGMAVGRWGCFLTEQIGTPTSLPWGISISPEVAARIPNCVYCAAGVRMHPSFIYEIIFHAIMFAWLWRLRLRAPGDGGLLKIYLLCYALFRFAVEFVRGNEAVWAGLTRSQLFLIPSTLLLLAHFWHQRERYAYARVAFEREA
jgi:phosphatidylglycerol---prolipoprotein diacylglyceryl transferase